MAQRRMFNKTVTNNDNFLEMPDSSQNLYFHLSMNADDDGFVDNWKSIMRMTGHKEDDLKVLIAKQYVIPFETGVIVIRHWRLNNYLQKDRIVPTIYKEEKQQLQVDKNNVYIMDTECIHSIDKYSIEENSIEENNLLTTTTNIYTIVEQNFGRTLSPIEIQRIDEWSSSYDEEIIKYAISIAVMNNKKTFNYVNGILKNWKSAGYKTIQEIKDNEIRRKPEHMELDPIIAEIVDYNWLDGDNDED